MARISDFERQQVQMTHGPVKELAGPFKLMHHSFTQEAYTQFASTKLTEQGDTVVSLQEGPLVEYWYVSPALRSEMYNPRIRRARTFELGETPDVRRLIAAEVSWEEVPGGKVYELTAEAKSPFEEEYRVEKGIPAPEKLNIVHLKAKKSMDGQEDALVRYDEGVGFLPTVHLNIPKIGNLRLMVPLGSSNPQWDVTFNGADLTEEAKSVNRFGDVKYIYVETLKLGKSVPLKRVGVEVGIWKDVGNAKYNLDVYSLRDNKPGAEPLAALEIPDLSVPSALDYLEESLRRGYQRTYMVNQVMRYTPKKTTG